MGPSGSGKSSILKAGVIPAIRKDDDSDELLVAEMVPGSHPFAELEAALLRSSLAAPDSIAEQLGVGPDGTLRAVLRVLPDPSSRMLLAIDQFEELFSLVDDVEVRARFLAHLMPVLDDPTDAPWSCSRSGPTSTRDRWSTRSSVPGSDQASSM